MEVDMSRRPRITALISGLALTAFALSGCASAATSGDSSEAENTSITVGVFTSSPINILERLAQSEGFFENRGMDVEFLEIASGPELTSAVVGGTAQYSIGMVPVVAGAVSNGECLTYLSAGQRSMYDIIAQPEWKLKGSSPMEKIASLKGARVSVPAIGGVVHVATQKLFAEAGLGEGDVTYIATGGFATGLPSFQEGQVDVMIAYPPMMETLNDSEFQFVVDLHSDSAENPWSKLLQGGAVVRCDYAEQNPEQVVQYCSALWDAWDFAMNEENLDAVVTKLADSMVIDPNIAEQLWGEYAQTFPSLVLDQELWNAQKQFLPAGVEMPDFKAHTVSACASGDPR